MFQDNLIRKNQLHFVPLEVIRTVRQKVIEPILEAAILADLFRINILYMIMRAGSGHIGTSFSSIDIVTWLWTKVLQNPNEHNAPVSDIYFSSKGHDAPALYAVLLGLEKLDFKYIDKLRQLNGLPGHPDISIPYLVTNTGPLGMGVSKARGMAWAKRLKKQQGRIYVLTGDGELQEGQIWESLQPVANQKLAEMTMIVDHNQLQSDLKVKDISDLGDLEEKFRAFGWAVFRVNGHNFAEISQALDEAQKVIDRPQVIIADTIKGQGVSFMEGVGEYDDAYLYRYHSGAPSYEEYTRALAELVAAVNKKMREANLPELNLESVEAPKRLSPKNPERLVRVYGEELVAMGKKHKEVVVLDADLILDTGVIPFKQNFPERFFECGIAEQDMVSMAGGLALQNMIPVVHTFACFLSTRSNEQIYNNASEKTKIIYVGSLAGLLPGAPGHSHQSVRDISTLGSIPGLVMVEPANEEETRQALRWAVEKNPGSTYLRLVTIPVEPPYTLSRDYELSLGKGCRIRDGKNAAIIAYGPVMLREAYQAAELLGKQGLSVAVYNLPWLNEIDKAWLEAEFRDYPLIVTLDDHYEKLGQGNLIAVALAGSGKRIFSFGLKEIPACGQNQEVLKYHGLDARSLANKIREMISSGGK